MRIIPEVEIALTLAQNEAARLQHLKQRAGISP